MKQPIVMIAALAFTVNAQAQSVEEGIKMYQYERYETAKKILSPLAATNPLASYYLGLSELETGNVAGAKVIFTKYNDNYANVSGLARVSFAEGKVAEGMQSAQGLAAKAKKKDWEQLKYAADAVTYSEGGNTQMAIDWYKTAIANNPTNNELLINAGDAYQKLPGGGGQAMTSYEKASERDAKNSLAFSRIGKLWYDGRNYEKALSNWEKAKDADPSNPLPYRDMASAYSRSGKYDLAKQNIEKYYELSDKTTEDKLSYMDALFLAKDYQKAVQMANDLISSGSTNPRIYGLLGFSQYELKDSTNALKNARVYFDKREASKVTPSDFILLGKIFIQNGQPDSADVYFNKAIAKDTAVVKTGTYREIAEGFKAAKSYTKAALWYQKITETDPAATATDYFWTGAMYYYANNYAEAGKWFEQMETKFPDQPSATYWRGRVGAAIDNEAKEGASVPHYTKWLEKVGPTYDKKADLKQAYQYLVLYYYNKSDKANLQKYSDLLRQIDPEDGLLKQIEAPAKAPAKGK